MNTSDELAPAVRSILEAAEARPGGEKRLSVDPRSLPAAVDEAGSDGRTPIIAEVKPTSPTTDGEREDDPVELAEAMVDGGAAALSVLTEPEHFGGSPETLRAVREAVDVPILRKDFIVREAQLDTVEADVVLLIVRFVDDLEGLLAAARERGFQALVEVHTEAELEEALDAGAELIGINNRDLGKLEVDLGTFERVAEAIPADDRESVTLIAESGVATREDVTRMRKAGADALLVGSAIMDGPVRENTERLTNV
ncbi:indole-3-glycerol-phosphate synthase [Natronomonas gomsonensis]|mgnify:CR=1 FL=1|jgi:indole-3-glycerol phosphate synthase|uniref:indole-3-glycerol phosphate synthase n=1 Tax=Natronomonas gomsonensis TaxID=1046043 RepID=UPI0020CA36A8|nr:indole-3-glycerol phosphate synthase [Natronomonas gomsonensis]MCY4731720.1 indole-3-glycerol-phosphate synthase [Natronomonas gomsonensis]